MLQSLVQSAGVDVKFADALNSLLYFIFIMIYIFKYIYFCRYAIHSNLSTGQCIILISEPYRSLVANVGAAAKYTLNDFKACNLSFDRIKIIYIEGFFIPHSFSVIKKLNKQKKEI